MDDLSRDYVIWVFLAATGVIQIAAAHAGLTKLLFIRARPWAYALGFLLVVAGFAWFFREGARHVPDTAAGINGNEQAARFTLTCLAAGAFTMLVSSVLNFRPAEASPDVAEGLEALRPRTYVQALTASLKSYWSEGHRWMRR